MQALLPLARGTLAAIESAGIARGMPGPVSRGDVGSIHKHVAALSALGDDTLALYRLLCGRTVPPAQQRGAIDAAVAQALLDVLGAARRDAGPPSGGRRV